MLVESEGRNYTAAEYSDWLTEVGFVDPQVVPFEAPGAKACDGPQALSCGPSLPYWWRSRPGPNRPTRAWRLRGRNSGYRIVRCLSLGA